MSKYVTSSLQASKGKQDGIYWQLSLDATRFSFNESKCSGPLKLEKQMDFSIHVIGLNSQYKSSTLYRLLTPQSNTNVSMHNVMNFAFSVCWRKAINKPLLLRDAHVVAFGMIDITEEKEVQ